MRQKEINENNILIAEFMELEFGNVITTDHEMLVFFNDRSFPEKIKYYNNWNWLMSVVKLILPPSGWILKLIPYQRKVIQSLQYADIEKVYIAVVEFIKEHNKNYKKVIL